MMRSRVLAGVATMAVVAAACGGGDSGGPQTEQGALDAVKRSQEAVLQGDADGVIDFLSAECRESIDEDEVRLALGFAAAFLGDEVDLDAIEVETSIEEFDGDTAEVSVEYVLPEDSAVDDLFFSTETIDVMYEDGKWVAEDCDFGDDSEQAADELNEELAAAGLAATRDDPAPAGNATPVGGGFTVSVDLFAPDAYEAVQSAGGFMSEPEPGNVLVLVDVTIGYRGSDEPVGVGELYFTGVGGTSAVGVDFYGCSGMEGELDAFGTALMSGGVTSGSICGEVPASDVDGLLLNVGPNFSDNLVFIDPAVPAASSTPVTGSTGPDPDGDLTEGRNAPIAVGTPTDVGEGWTMTVNGLNPDADGTLAANEFNDPAPAGSVFVLVDLTLEYEGEETGSATAIDLHMVGDSNLAVRSGSCSVSWDGELDRFSEVFDGGTLTGELCFRVPESDLDSIVLLATAEFGGDPEVFAVG